MTAHDIDAIEFIDWFMDEKQKHKYMLLVKSDDASGFNYAPLEIKDFYNEAESISRFLDARTVILHETET